MNRILLSLLGCKIEILKGKNDEFYFDEIGGLCNGMFVDQAQLTPQMKPTLKMFNYDLL